MWPRDSSMRKVELTPEEEKVIEDAKAEPLWGYPRFCDYFFSGDDTGTWFTEEEDDYMYDTLTRYTGGGVTMYEYLYKKWARENHPSSMWADPPFWAKGWFLDAVRYEVPRVEHGMPQFFWKHGWIPLEWGTIMHYAKQPNHVVLGGFGCSKTTHVGVSGFVHCATIPRYKFACVAAFLSQARPMYDALVSIFEDTRAIKLIQRGRNGEPQYTTSPTPRIRFHNKSEMIFMGADKDLSKIRSYEGDWVVVEQAESHSSLAEINRELGSRRRGRVRGRRRMGRMTHVANSGDAPELWQMFDDAKENPQRWFAFAMSSYQNPHLNEDDIKNLEDACGNDEEEIKQYMLGQKPSGRYKDFPQDTVLGCESESLRDLMRSLVEKGEDDFRELELPGIGHVEWSLPARGGRDYAVYGDPGTRNPPHRGAGVVLVLDETNFPKRPAELVHFKWTVGDGHIGPWLDDFEDAVKKYGANGRAYYDSTGDQKNLDELSFADRNLLVEGISMAGIKHGMRLKLLRIMERQLIQWSKSISPIRQQFSKYDEQVDKATSKLPQDIVMTFYLAGEQLSGRMVSAPGATGKGAQRKMVRGRGGIRRNRKITKRARR